MFRATVKYLIAGLLVTVLLSTPSLIKATWNQPVTLQLPQIKTTSSSSVNDFRAPILESLTAGWWKVEVPAQSGGWLIPPTSQTDFKCHGYQDLENENTAVTKSSCRLEVGRTLAVESIKPPCWQHPQGIEALSIRNQRQIVSPGEVVISEVMWAGSFEEGHSRAYDEWLELANTTSEYLLIDNLQLKNAAYFNRVLSFPPETAIAPYSFIVVSHYAAHNSQLSIEPDLVLSNLQLSNQRANLQLVTSDGQIIDQLPAGSWQAGLNDTSQKKRASAQRLFLNEPGNDWSNWQTCQREATTLETQAQYWKAAAMATNCGSPGKGQLY